MAKSGLLGSAARFVGIGAGAAAEKKQDDEDHDAKAAKDCPKADDDEDAKSPADDDMAPTEQDDAKKKNAKGGKKKAGDGEEDDKPEDDAGEDDDEDEAEGDDKSPKRKPSEDDDEDEDDMKKGAKARMFRGREKARIAHIIGHPAAAGRVDAALNLALNSDMGRHKAVALLATLPKTASAAASTLAERMNQEKAHNAGAGAAPGERGKSIVAAALEKQTALYK